MGTVTPDTQSRMRSWGIEGSSETAGHAAGWVRADPWTRQATHPTPHTCSGRGETRAERSLLGACELVLDPEGP